MFDHVRQDQGSVAFAEFRNVEATLGLAIATFVTQGGYMAFKGQLSKLVETAFGRIKLINSNFYTTIDEPFALRAIMNMAIVMGSMQITNRLDMEDAKTKQTILGVYIAAQVIVIGASYIIRRRIQAKKDTSVLKYINPPKPFSGEQAKVVTTTNMEYDLEQNTQAQKQALIGLAVMVFLHFQWGMIRPLVVQSILPVKNVLQSKIAKVHLFGKPATGDLRRPWKADSPFAALSGGRDTRPSEATEKAAIKLVEDEERKAAGSGSKSETKKDR
ncbi:hypothetical protein BGZ98_004648 [Dissophora globulifera]|nr:hypothetical protein BGZ98_004648 [Dissophora globulifera]